MQCIYFDPPYGIKFNSNFQWSTTSRDVKDGKADHITREPEQVKAFRDTWRDGIHSYLTYLRDRLTVARDLLTDSGSIFVQIGDENVHRVRAVMDEVFGEDNFVSLISFAKTGGSTERTSWPDVATTFCGSAKDKTRSEVSASSSSAKHRATKEARTTTASRLPDRTVAHRRSSERCANRHPVSCEIYSTRQLDFAERGRDKATVRLLVRVD